MNDDIQITPYDNGDFCARIPGILAAGIGPTEADAIKSLCSLLGDFVMGRDQTIDKMREGMLVLANPPLPSITAPVPECAEPGKFYPAT